MDSIQPSEDNLENKNDETQTNTDIETTKIESMITPEQVLSASVARKRRNISKKRASAVVRDQTPCRELVSKASSDENLNEEPAKIPERPRRKINRTGSERKSSGVEITEIADNDAAENNLERNDSIPKEYVDKPKKKSLTDITQTEVINFLQKAKRSITSGRERFRKSNKIIVKRSQSTPDDLTEIDGRELLSRKYLHPNDFIDDRRYSTDSYSGDEIVKRKPYRPEVREYVARKKKQRQSSERIIQILDPKTKKVVTTKGTSQLKFGMLDFLKVLRHIPIKDLLKEYKAYKIDMRTEYDRIRSLRNKCLNELFVIMLFCGFGSFMFKFVEGAFENFYKCGVKRVKRDFIDNLWTKSHNLREEDWKSLARNKLRIFEEELHTAHEAGVHSYSGQKSWSFLNGIVYCLTIVTTIGKVISQ